MTRKRARCGTRKPSIVQPSETKAQRYPRTQALDRWRRRSLVLAQRWIIPARVAPHNHILALVRRGVTRNPLDRPMWRLPPIKSTTALYRHIERKDTHNPLAQSAALCLQAGARTMTQTRVYVRENNPRPSVFNGGAGAALTQKRSALHAHKLSLKGAYTNPHCGHAHNRSTRPAHNKSSATNVPR
jgi:hypothetical protein